MDAMESRAGDRTCYRLVLDKTPPAKNRTASEASMSSRPRRRRRRRRTGRRLCLVCTAKRGRLKKNIFFITYFF